MGRDVASVVQKKKSIKSSLGRFFSKKDKVKGVKDTMPDGSPSIISIGNYSINLSETDGSMDGGGGVSGSGGGGSCGGGGITPRAKALFIDYGRQKK